jgi:hypothetical protein
MEEMLCLQQKVEKGRVGLEEIATIAGTAKNWELKIRRSMYAESSRDRS